MDNDIKSLRAKYKAGASGRCADIKKSFLKLAARKYPDKAAVVQEYVDEAEHQEGDRYWDRVVKTAEGALKDFEIYLENRD